MSIHSQFLIRPKPIEGESLSSWRQRSAWRNGYTLFPVSSEKLRRIDPDVGLHETELTWLAGAHNLEVQSLRPLTLVGKLGLINYEVGPHSQPSWWLRSRVAGAKQKTGPMYCPLCLAEDEVPFFRLHWRFGFVTSCTIHDVELLDRCPTCREPMWPGGAGIPSNLSPRFTSFCSCWSCGSEISNTQRIPADASLERVLLFGLQDRAIKFGAVAFPISEVLQALRGICQLFVRSRTRALILKSHGGLRQIFEDLPPESLDARAIELMGVVDRRRIVPIAWEILSDWPGSFNKFCAQSRIEKWHFDGASHLNPRWMNTEIEDNLKRQNRSVTKALLAHTFNDLKESLGRTPQKSELRRALSWQGSKFLEDIYIRREQATQDEAQTLFQNAEKELLRCSDRRLSLFHAAVDIAVIVLCILEKRHIEQACTMNALQLEVWLCNCGLAEGISAFALIVQIRDTLRTYPTARKHSYTPILRQVKKRFSVLVQRCPEELTKSVSAYWFAEHPLDASEASPSAGVLL